MFRAVSLCGTQPAIRCAAFIRNAGTPLPAYPALLYHYNLFNASFRSEQYINSCSCPIAPDCSPSNRQTKKHPDAELRDLVPDFVRRESTVQCNALKIAEAAAPIDQLFRFLSERILCSVKTFRFQSSEKFLHRSMIIGAAGTGHERRKVVFLRRINIRLDIHHLPSAVFSVTHTSVCMRRRSFPGTSSLFLID